MYEQTRRAAWVEIDLSAAETNLRIIRERVGSERQIIAMVKADAYGHGATHISRALERAGCDMLAVATFDELARLRRGGVSLPVLLLGYVPEYCLQDVIRLGGLFTVYDYEQAQEISAAAQAVGQDALVHIKVDTGMSRLGFEPDDAGAAATARCAALPRLRVQGVFSHFATADSANKKYSYYQVCAFERFIAKCKGLGLDFPLQHIVNSAGISDMPEVWYNAVRPGIIVYGCYGSSFVKQLPGLQPVMSVKAQIVRVHQLPAGGCVGYGCTWQARRPSVIATLPLGYADGVSRLLANIGQVLVRGQRVPIVGRICMDQLMIDVTDIAAETPMQRGEEVVLIGQQGADRVTVEEMAELAQTINYEILCHMGARLPRVFLRDGKPEE